MRDLLVPISLVAIGVLLLGCEAFIPSAGVLGVLSATALIAGVLSAFYFGGLAVGTGFMAATFFGVGALIVFMVRRWPHTTIGKLILVEPPQREKLLPDRSEFQALVGQVGCATSVMLPSGFVEIEGKRYDATAEGAVEAGTWVEVVAIRSGRILLVRPVSEEVARRARSHSSQTGEKSADPLSSPSHDVVPDPFDDALG